MNSCSYYIVTSCDNFHAVYTSTDIKKGDVVFDLSEVPVVGYNSKFNITKVPGKEYWDTRTIDFLRYLNHSCVPNLVLDRKKQAFVALRPISIGEELSFDYEDTEPEVCSPFMCRCLYCIEHKIVRLIIGYKNRKVREAILEDLARAAELREGKRTIHEGEV
jgi:hypothetical protein